MNIDILLYIVICYGIMPAITLETVTQAAESIIANGGTPSLRVVREQLGGGSPNVILPLLRQWKEGHARKAMPSDQAVAAVQESTHRLYQAALDQARAELKADLAAAIAERDEARHAADEHEAELENVRDLLAENGKDLAQARAQVSDLAAARDGLDTVSRTLREVAGHQAQALAAVDAAQRDLGQRILSALAVIEHQLAEQRIAIGRIERRLDDLDARAAVLAGADERILAACTAAQDAAGQAAATGDERHRLLLLRLDLLDGAQRRLMRAMEMAAARDTARHRRTAERDRIRR